MTRVTRVVGKWVSAAGDTVTIRIHTGPGDPLKTGHFPPTLKCMQDFVVVSCPSPCPPLTPLPARSGPSVVPGSE